MLSDAIKEQWHFVSTSQPAKGHRPTLSSFEHVGRTSNIVERLELSTRGTRGTASSHNCLHDGNPILAKRGTKIRISMLLFANRFTKVTIMHVFRVNSDGIRAVVKLVNHSTLVQRQVKLLALFPAVTLNLDKSHLHSSCGGGSEEVVSRDAMWNMALPIAHGPGAWTSSPLERCGRRVRRMAFVDAAGDVGVASGAEDGGGAGVGVDAGEVGREQGGSSGPGRGQWRYHAGRRRIRFRRSGALRRRR